MFNMPDGCMYPSDLDQYVARNPREREEIDEFDWTEEEETI